MICREEVLHDVASMAYVAADIREGKLTPHALHQTFDICEGGNLDRVTRVMDIAEAELRSVLREFNITLPDSGEEKEGYAVLLRMYAHEYVVARILADWLSVTLPESAGVWQEKADDALSRFRLTVETRVCRAAILSRRLPPF